MLYISLVMGVLTAELTDYWLGRATLKDPLRVIVAGIVGALVTILTYSGRLLHF